MRRFFIVAAVFAAALSLNCTDAGAWGRTGHKVVVAIAQRHLSERTRRNIDALLGYDFREDASWMDDHRKDEEYAYTGNYHCMGMSRDYIYDPTVRMQMGGDCVSGLQFVDYMLTHTGELHAGDSVRIFHLRMLIHIVGDMHSLPHAYMYPERNQWPCRLAGVEYKYHGFLDRIPDTIWAGKTVDEIALDIDTFSRRQIKACTKGSFVDWAQDCCTRDKVIYDVNPYGTYDMDPDTIEKITPAVREALAFAGYRLACLLEKYFSY